MHMLPVPPEMRAESKQFDVILKKSFSLLFFSSFNLSIKFEMPASRNSNTWMWPVSSAWDIRHHIQNQIGFKSDSNRTQIGIELTLGKCSYKYIWDISHSNVFALVFNVCRLIHAARPVIILMITGIKIAFEVRQPNCRPITSHVCSW